MNIEQFNKKYGEQGGIKHLSSMRENFETLKKIAGHFEVSNERVRQWMVEFFGEKYDPRFDRRKKRIKTIKKLIERYGVKQTQALYPGINRSYLQAAINSSHKQKNENTK